MQVQVQVQAGVVALWVGQAVEEGVDGRFAFAFVLHAVHLPGSVPMHMILVEEEAEVEAGVVVPGMGQAAGEDVGGWFGIDLVHAARSPGGMQLRARGSAAPALQADAACMDW